MGSATPSYQTLLAHYPHLPLIQLRRPLHCSHPPTAFFSLVLVRGFAGVEDWMQRVHPIYPSFSLVMTKSGLLARDPSRLPSYRSCTHRYHPYTMAGRASRDEDTCMVRALTRPSSLLADENQ